MADVTTVYHFPEFTVCVAVFSILVVVWNGFHQISFRFD